MTEKTHCPTVENVGPGCGAAQVLGNSQPAQPPHASEGQSDIRKPGRFRQATPNSSELAPAVGVITPNVLRTMAKSKKQRIEVDEAIITTIKVNKKPSGTEKPGPS